MDIPFTFGIITNSSKEVNSHLIQAVQSIHELKIPEYEIIIVGTESKLKAHDYFKDNNPKVKFINFNENIKPAWITKKKNLITQHARFDNIVYQHDYIYYDSNWYNGFKKFGDKFDVCMTQIKNQDGTRFRDWVIFPYHHCYPLNNPYAKQAKELWKYAGIENNECIIPYDETRLTKFQYVSGSYWVAKKYVMLDYALDESLSWGRGEDCVWSMNFLNKYNLTMNPNSIVHFAKWKQDAFSPMRQEWLDKCIEFVSKNN